MKSWAVYLDTSRDALVAMPHTQRNNDAFGEPIQEDFANQLRAELWADNAQLTLNRLKRAAHGATAQ